MIIFLKMVEAKVGKWVIQVNMCDFTFKLDNKIQGIKNKHLTRI